jgi:hypothetical protein
MTALEKISRKQEQALIALLTSPSILEAAQHCGMTEVTLHRWLKQEAFHSAYQEARRELMRHAIVQLQQTAADAVATLRAIMKDTEASPPGARVAAARITLEMSFRGVELDDLEWRVASLEEALAEAHEASGLPVNGVSVPQQRPAHGRVP